MTIISSGALALDDLGANTTYFINDSFTAGSNTTRDIDGDFQVEDPNTGQTSTVTRTIWQGPVYGYNLNAGASGQTGWKDAVGWGVDWDDGGNVRPDVGSLAAMGSGLTVTYTDGSSTSRTVVTVGLADGSKGPDGTAPDKFLILALAGANIPDSDNTFKQITYGGLTLDRSAKDYKFNTNVCTVWIWELTLTQRNSAGSGTGTKTFQLVQTSGTNNGIAEEFGGDNAGGGAPVAMSEYYKGGTFVTSNVTASIPTSGEIAFSDFYGATYAAGSFHTTTMTVGTAGGYGYAHSGFSSSGSLGSLGDATLTYNSRAVTITRLRGEASSSTVSTGTVDFIIDDDLATTSPPNSGWTTMNIYKNQTDNSGSPDNTLSRSAATYTASGGVGFANAKWSWTVAGDFGGAFYGTWFGGTSGDVHFIEII